MKSRLFIFLLLVCIIPVHAMTWHPQEAGASWAGNPLKGMLAYDFSDYAFPHSMEWFYLPVNDVQQSMTVYDWSKLEKRLNAIAARGHQAVFRFYYDYPGEPTGIPEFVRNSGLSLRYYNEPDDLGGAGYCPDYSNAYFRQSMQAFIAEFGKKYDGDGRIGFITIGLLGFWGEWHNWPYDEDISDDKPDWSIPSVVYKEVQQAFEAAFKFTKVCAREPKWGVDYTDCKVGFHDDSFAYATLSKDAGGQDWSFWQKVKNFGLSSIWETQAIGGEIYPPLQTVLFNGGSWECQDWNTCVAETHPTWMLNENIKYYRGNAYTAANAASMQMGYDLQVTSAYFDPITTAEHLPFTVQIRNNGVAPFYYGPDLWPIAIGLRQNGAVVAEVNTPWDLRTIAADGQIVTFDYTWERYFPKGSYEICIRVVNPVAGGNILGFANARQEASGWLPLGTFEVKAPTEVTEAAASAWTAVLREDVLRVQCSDVQPIQVYTLSGKCVYSTQTDLLEFPTAERVLLVCVGGEVRKVMLLSL